MANENKYAVFEAALRIRNMPELSAFREFLKEEEANAINSMVGLNDDRQMHIAQGSVRTLRQIQDLIEESARLRDKTKPAGSGGFL